MALEGLVQSTDIAMLDLGSFRRLMNLVLGIEASVHGVAVGDVDLTLREFDPDGGVDARIRWPDSAPQEVLLSGDNVIQYKTGNVTKTTIKTEFNKPGVQRCLQAGGHYHFLISQDCNVQKLTSLESALAECCGSKGFDPKRCHLLAASHIARWVCRHPGAISCRELGKGLPGFSTVEEWANLRTLQNPWKSDDLRRGVIERVQALLATTDALEPVVRIEGPAGVGKTRLMLECIKAAGLESRTIYACNSEAPEVQQLLSAVQSSPRAYAIIVADECDRDRQNVLKSYADLAGGRVRLICVGPGDALFDSVADFSSVFVVLPMAGDQVREVLTAAFENVPGFVAEVAVRLSGGYPKLAFFVARAVTESSSISPEEIRRIPTIRDFLKRFLPAGTLNALRALSILQRLGWEAELRPEAEAVASYLGMAFSDLQEGVKMLRDQGVVVPQGRYLYVTPELLAIAAAADLWDARGPNLIRIIEQMPTPSSRRELLRRLAAMGRHREVRKVVEMLLGDRGLFQSLGDLDEEFRSEAFRILASALPEAAVTVLERIVEHAPRGQLLDFKVGRRDVIWAVETLLRWPETSLAAARSLRSLALAENETIGNNATAVFGEYFHIHLSRSPVPYPQRMHLIDDLIAAGDERSRLLAVCGLSAGLISYETRLGGDFDELARRPYPPEWRPKTWAELWEARRAAISRLQDIAAGADRAASEARKAQISAVFTVSREGMFEDVIKLLQNIRPETDDERRQVLDACLRLQKEGGEQLSKTQRTELEDLSRQLFGASYFARIKRWVGRRLNVDFDLKEDKGYAEADAVTVALADEGFNNGISDEELAWLASAEAENVWIFGLRLGELDAELHLFERIVACSPEDVNALFLAAYIGGQGKARGGNLRENLIDQLRDTYPLKAFTCTWRGEATRRGFERIVGLVESGKIPAERIGFLMYGGWTKILSADENATLVRLMLNGRKSAVLEPAMSILYDALQREPESIDRLEPLVWEIVEATPADAAVMMAWRWGRLAPIVAARDPLRIVRLIIRQYSSPTFIPLSDERRQLLQTATETERIGAWDAIAAALMSRTEASSALLTVLRGWYAELIPVEHLISWARSNEPRGPWIVAHLIRPDLESPSSRARALILAFRGNNDIWNELYANMVTGVWVGPYSNKIERDLAMAKRWATDPDPEFQAFARDVIRELERRLREQRTREEEGVL